MSTFPATTSLARGRANPRTWRALLLFVLMALIASTVFFGATKDRTAQAAYTLVWSDEFDGSSLNTSNWTYETGGGGWGNNERQYYTAGQNATVSGGVLTIQARRVTSGYSCWYGTCEWTSTRIKTQGKREFKYGRLEARLALPLGAGVWPAFWMLGGNFASVGWPASGEIDIMEHVNTDSTIYGTLHWDYNGYATYGGNTQVSGPTAYHVYAIEWTPSYIRWFIDGRQYHEANILNSINGTDEFHRPFFFLLNLAVGGNWPGMWNGTTPTTLNYLVDYVRVYQDNGTVAPTATRTRTNTAGTGATATRTRTACSTCATATRTRTRTPTTSTGTTTWAPNVWYAIGATVTYNGVSYRCQQAHTSQVGWEPPNVPALWVRL
jgi:beta-glucanase (GH16 family)